MAGAAHPNTPSSYPGAQNSWYQTNAKDSNGDTVLASQLSVRKLSLTAAQAATSSTTGVHAAITDTGAAATTTTGITNPPYPRNITATTGGTSADIAAISAIVTGTNMADEVITETLPIFTVNTATTVVGVKIFKTVTSIYCPAHDGTGATTSYGFGEKLGLPDLGARKTVLSAHLANVLEGTAATEARSLTALESNYVDLNSVLNGTAVVVYYHEQ